MAAYNKLRGRIVEKCGSQAVLAEKLGISENAMSKKMRCLTGFSQEDILNICEMLDISRAEIGDYFFADRVSHGKTDEDEGS